MYHNIYSSIKSFKRHRQRCHPDTGVSVPQNYSDSSLIVHDDSANGSYEMDSSSDDEMDIANDDNETNIFYDKWYVTDK